VVGEAIDGHDAVQKTQNLRPDLAILDITMPGLDGLEVTRRIQRIGLNTKTLILTMHESDQMVRRVLEAGARGYVLKSDLATDLVRAVSLVAQGKLFLTPKVSEIVLRAFLRTENHLDSPELGEKRPTRREIEIIQLLAEGKSNKQIASILNITVRTVETHRARIMLKLGVHSLVELVHYANRHGMTHGQSNQDSDTSFRAIRGGPA